MAILETFPRGNGGGHTILDGEGTALTQEKNLQIEGLDVADDSTNEATVFSPIGLNADSIDDIAEANSVVPAVIIGDANNYSTSEKIVGKWIDGKPIYQKTINCGTGPKTTTKNVPHNVDNMDITVNIFGIGIISSGVARSVILPSDVVPGSSHSISTERRNENIQIGANFDASDFNMYVTIQYTKTTD